MKKKLNQNFERNHINQGLFRKLYREKITYFQKNFFLISEIIFSKKKFFFYKVYMLKNLIEEKIS
jgi:hypothetical protein